MGNPGFRYKGRGESVSPREASCLLVLEHIQAGQRFGFSTQSLIFHLGSCWRPVFLMHFTGNQEKTGRGET